MVVCGKFRDAPIQKFPLPLFALLLTEAGAALSLLGFVSLHFAPFRALFALELTAKSEIRTEPNRTETPKWLFVVNKPNELGGRAVSRTNRARSSFFAAKIA